MYKSEKQILQEKDEEIKTLKKSLERSYSEEEVNKLKEELQNLINKNK